MVICLSNRRNDAGWLMVELLAAMVILTAAVLPVAYSFASEKKLAQAQYRRAIATEIVDGEFELLTAGQWRSFSPGTHQYQPRGWSVTNLPRGSFVLQVATNHLRLTWSPAPGTRGGGSVTREQNLR